MIRVAAAIVQREDTYMIARRASGKLAGYWEFPGGKIEPEETAEQCLARELLEELDLKVQVGALFGTNVHHYDDITVELIAYWAEIDSGVPALRDHDEVRFVKLDELASYTFAPADVPFVERLVGMHST